MSNRKKVKEVRRIQRNKNGVLVTFPPQWLEEFNYVRIKQKGNQIILTPLKRDEP
ncbi:MAG: hypothetical protein ACFFD2_19810 [Promethearchaeota archaeon]